MRLGNRRIHYWLSIASALPVLVIIATGLLLHLKKDFAWIQPAEPYRRSDIIEALHDGSWFHPAVKRWVFLPAGAALLALWVTGIYLFIQPLYARRRRSEPGP